MSKNFDMLIKKAFEETRENVILPPKDEIWDRIANELHARKREQQKKRLKSVMVSCLAVILTFMLVAFDTPVRAVVQNALSLVTSFTGNVLKLSVSGNRDAEASLADHPDIVEVRQQVSFDILLPGYMSPGYVFEEIKVVNEKGMKKGIRLYFTMEEESSPENSIVIKQVPVTYGTDISASYKSTSDIKVEERMVNDVKYILLSYENGSSSVVWNTGSFLMDIRGNHPAQELLKIAESMK